MFFALVGAVTALAFLSRWHERSLARLQVEQFSRMSAAVN
jgi:hypothetical protein